MDIYDFYVVGINYKETPADIRSIFAINTNQYLSLLSTATSFGVNEFFILSTCNRTEIYGFAHNSEQLIDFLCSQTAGDVVTFKKTAYIKNAKTAIEHIFCVAAGLDSQILGDYEIIGQLKAAVKLSKQHGYVKAFTERLVNSVLQSSKLIKNHTKLSGGTVSVSFAAVQFIRKNFENIKQKKILLLGVGKIGRNTCKNLVDYLNTNNITLINRSPEKAVELAAELNLNFASVENLDEEIKSADIILVATNADEPIILKSHLENRGKKLIIDLSVPYNVEEAAKNLDNIQIINVDELSRLKDETLKKRELEIPKAEKIISELMEEFFVWLEMRKHVSMLKELKIKLKHLHSNSLYLDKTSFTCEKSLDTKIQRVLNNTAENIKVKKQKGCQYITAINEFISAGLN